MCVIASDLFKFSEDLLREMSKLPALTCVSMGDRTTNLHGVTLDRLASIPTLRIIQVRKNAGEFSMSNLSLKNASPKAKELIYVGVGKK